MTPEMEFQTVFSVFADFYVNKSNYHRELGDWKPQPVPILLGGLGGSKMSFEMRSWITFEQDLIISSVHLSALRRGAGVARL